MAQTNSLSPKEFPPTDYREAIPSPEPQEASAPFESFESSSFDAGNTQEQRAPESFVDAPAPVQPPAYHAVPAAPAPLKKDRLEKEIEEILEEDLHDLYRAMSPQQQQAFKIKGEETVSLVRKLVHETKKHARKIFHLIRDWLKLIPSVNRYYLEQEAKLKTDKVIRVAEEERRRGLKDLV